MAITNFKEQIEDMIGTIPDTISDHGEGLFANGIADVIKRFMITSPNMMPLFAVSTDFCPDEGSRLKGFAALMAVTANDGNSDIQCMPILKRHKQKVQKGSGSLYEATLNSPVFYIEDGKVYTAPQRDYIVTIAAETLKYSLTESDGALYAASGSAPAIGDVFKVVDDTDFTDGELTTAKGSSPVASDYFRIIASPFIAEMPSLAIEYLDNSNVDEVGIGVITNYLTGNSSIANYPTEFYYLPVLYAAHFIALHKMALLPADGDVSSALVSSTSAISDVGAIITTMLESSAAGDSTLDDVAFTEFGTAISEVDAIMQTQVSNWDAFVTDEDPEMAQIALAGTQSRLAEAGAQLQKIQNQIGQAGAYNAIAQGYAAAVNAQIGEANASLSYVQAKLGSLAADMGTYSNLSQALWSQYEKAFVPYSKEK